MRIRDLLIVSLAAVALQGCVARTATKIVTAPVKAVSSGVDAATTSQSEADENRGRELREREEQLAKLERDYNAAAQSCSTGNSSACDQAKAIEAEMKALTASASAAPQSD